MLATPNRRPDAAGTNATHAGTVLAEGKTVEKTCLIVDDEPTIRAYLRVILHGEKYRTIEAENAAQAFKLVQRLNGSLSLIVSDISMPGDMDGVDLAYAIRNAYPAIPVVLVSGCCETAAARRKPGDVGFVQKPFTTAAILGAVSRVTASSMQTGPASA
jgi:DNA-binding NtrC family response regulator